MLLMVTGGSGSGKSAYAEGRVLMFGEGERLYLATMRCYDEETKRRIERHRRMRSGKGFETVERCVALSSLKLSDTNRQ